MTGLYLFLGAVVCGAYLEEREQRTGKSDDLLFHIIFTLAFWPLIAGCILQSKEKQGDQ